jgi:hypothetical protein
MIGGYHYEALIGDQMLSLTAKHFVTDMPDEFREAVVHPPSWVVSVEPVLDGSACLAYLDRDQAISVRCEDLMGLAELLHQLRDFEVGVDTAVHRSYHQYDFWFATFATGRWDRGNARICLNSCADVGREPEALKAVLAWLAAKLHTSASRSSVVKRLSLWMEPPDSVVPKVLVELSCF